MKLLILTAEPKNFVPVEIEKAAIAKDISCKVIDVRKIVIQESLDGKLFVLEGSDEDKKLVPIEYDSQTIVIPRLNEYHLDTKIGILQRMQNGGCLMVNSPQGMALCNDKLLSQVSLNNAGIRTPKSWVIQDADAFDTVIKLMEEMKLFDFPIIVKTFRGTHGIGVMKLDSRSSLVSVGQTLLKEGIDFMLQEFCKHDQSCRIIMKGQELLAANLRGQPKEKDEFRTNSHLGSETEPYTPSEKELEVAKRIVGIFGTQFCAIDYIMVGEGEEKEVLIIEVNGSPGLEAIQKNWPSKNLAAELVDFAGSLLAPTEAVPPETTTAEDPASVEEPKEEQPEDRLQLIEPVTIHRIMDNVDAKIDTGAKTCSIHVDKIDSDGKTVKFTRGDVTYRVPLYSTVRIKNNAGGESSERPVIQLDITIKGRRFNRVSFSLNNRGHMNYEVLVGRNLIELIGLPIAIPPEGATVDTASDEAEVEEE